MSRGSSAAPIQPPGPGRRPGNGAAPAPRRAPGSRPAPRHLTVVDANVRRRARRVRVAVWGFGVVTALSVFIAVAFHVVLAQSEFQLDHLSRQTDVAQRRYEHARLSVAQLGSPARIVARAEQLGMEPADDIRYLTAPIDVAPGGGGSSRPIEGSTGEPGGEWEKVKRHLGAQP